MIVCGFGMSSVSEMFQNVIANVISGNYGSFNMSNDIFVFGKGETDDDALCRTWQVLRLSAEEARRERTDSQVWVQKAKNGVFKERDRTRSEESRSTPRNESAYIFDGEVQSLLGITKFIPNYSTVAAHLRKLTSKEQEFKWELEQQSAFETLKTVLGMSPVAVYFNREGDIDHSRCISCRARCDASTVPR